MTMTDDKTIRSMTDDERHALRRQIGDRDFALRVRAELRTERFDGKHVDVSPQRTATAALSTPEPDEHADIMSMPEAQRARLRAKLGDTAFATRLRGQLKGRGIRVGGQR